MGQKLSKPSEPDKFGSKCKHFNGLTNKCCDAGVPYDTFRDASAGSDRTHFPCFRDRMTPDTICEKREWELKADVAARQKAFEESLARVESAVAVIAEDVKAKGYKKGNGGQGELVCPACQTGKLLYSVSSYNGHLAAKCSTGGCVSFMS